MMETLPEFVGTVHIFLGPYRGNPIALYLRQDSETYKISPRIYPWNRTIGIGENPNKAAADFEDKWKKNGLSADMYSGPHWEGGIKPEKPKPPPKPAAPKAAATAPKTEAKSETASEANPASKAEPASEAKAPSETSTPPPTPASAPLAKAESPPEAQPAASSSTPPPASPPVETENPKDPPAETA